MPRVKDLTNQVFGRLTVLRCVERNRHGHAIWACRCSCNGREIEVRGSHLTGEDIMSCGCARREMSAARQFKHGHSVGNLLSPTYFSWSAMIKRCSNPNDIGFSRYGGAGITVCDRWQGEHGFETFLVDMGERPQGKTLGRFGDVGNYEPENCAWQTSQEQGAERRMKNQLKFLELVEV